jgi:thymidine phosphorylase
MQGEPLLTLHVNDRRRLDEATRLLRDAVRVAPEAPPRAALIQSILN